MRTHCQYASRPGELLLITQNVDDLHERAGSQRLIHMHGELASGWCLACDERFPWNGPMGEGASDWVALRVFDSVSL